MSVALTTSVLRAVVTTVTVFAVAACKGESPTGPDDVFPYDIVLERRDGPSGPPDLYVLDLGT
ncbi:MAG: hypothetical protein M3282_02275, partial [Gemmatimonadota bacterium]|nr:hypothetical protein [Gemmatimonadota bacterium]